MDNTQAEKPVMQHQHTWSRVSGGPWLHCSACDKWKYQPSEPERETEL